MKQFGKILKFELIGYLKNKIFVGITLFFMIAIILGMNIPKLLAMIEIDDTSETDPGVMIVHSSDVELMNSVRELFAEAFTEYEVKISEQGEDSIKAQITDGSADCAFILTGADSYVYYVNNLSMYDTNTAVADAVLSEICAMNAMIESGLTPEQASGILSVTVSGTTETLGKNQIQNVCRIVKRHGNMAYLALTMQLINNFERVAIFVLDVGIAIECVEEIKIKVLYPANCKLLFK